MSTVEEKKGTKTRVNSEIRLKQLRLIDQDGQQAGLVSSEEALRLAVEAGLDLVEISPHSDPPVCRIMDYGKFIYQLRKKKKPKQTQLKEIKLRPVTDEGDYQVKLRNLRRFLYEGDKVKVSLKFRGREMTHQELGFKMLERLAKDVESFAAIEQHPKMEGRQMIMMLAPKKKGS